MTRYFGANEDFVFPASFGFSKSATPSTRGQTFAKGGKVVSPEAYGLTNGHVDPPVRTTRKTPVKTEVRSGLASGGQVAEPPGPSPAKGMQPLTRRPYKPVDVPSPLAEKGAKKIPVPVVTKAPAAAPPEEVSPMRKGGRVKRAHGGSIDVDEAADDFRRNRPDWTGNLYKTRPGYLDTDAKMEDTPVPGTRERGSGRGGITAPGEDPGPRDLAKGGRIKREDGGLVSKTISHERIPLKRKEAGPGEYARGRGGNLDNTGQMASPFDLASEKFRPSTNVDDRRDSIWYAGNKDQYATKFAPDRLDPNERRPTMSDYVDARDDASPSMDTIGQGVVTHRAKGGRVRRAMGGPMDTPMPPPAPPMPAQPGMPQQPTPVMPTLALPMPRMAKGGAIKRAKGGQVRKGCY